MDTRFRGHTSHTYNKNHLSDIIFLPYPLLVILPNGYKVKVTEVVSVSLTSKITLHKVVFIPTFKYNLISINTLAFYLKCLVSFSNSSSILQGTSMKRCLKIGRVQDRLYLLCSTCLKRAALTFL